jgi:hypothetical protein
MRRILGEESGRVLDAGLRGIELLFKQRPCDSSSEGGNADPQSEKDCEREPRYK